MKVYWSKCGPRHGNFGDKITPLLLRQAGVRCDWAPPQHARFIGAGSILEKVPEEFRGTIWTTGFISENSRRKFPHATILGVRGRLTLDQIKVNQHPTVLLGDAGLIVDILAPSAPKRFALGIVPHFTEQGDPVLEHLRAKDGNISIIDICDEPTRVLASITECEHIVSTSLHGLVIADSYGIPNHWVHLSRRGVTVTGDGFKFRDYYSAFGLDAPAPELITAEDTARTIIQRLGPCERPHVLQRKAQLMATLNAFAGSELAREPEAELAKERNEWNARLNLARETLVRILPADAVLVLADEDQLRHTLPFPQVFGFKDQDGVYWGPPSDDTEAINELIHCVSRGAEFFALGFPAFWMSQRFKEFFEFLRERAECLHSDSQILVFALRRNPVAAPLTTKRASRD